MGADFASPTPGGDVPDKPRRTVHDEGHTSPEERVANKNKRNVDPMMISSLSPSVKNRVSPVPNDLASVGNLKIEHGGGIV